jgi:hypothetical protein
MRWTLTAESSRGRWPAKATTRRATSARTLDLVRGEGPWTRLKCGRLIVRRVARAAIGSANLTGRLISNVESVAVLSGDVDAPVLRPRITPRTPRAPPPQRAVGLQAASPTRPLRVLAPLMSDTCVCFHSPDTAV